MKQLTEERDGYSSTNLIKSGFDTLALEAHPNQVYPSGNSLTNTANINMNQLRSRVVTDDDLNAQGRGKKITALEWMDFNISYDEVLKLDFLVYVSYRNNNAILIMRNRYGADGVFVGINQFIG